MRKIRKIIRRLWRRWIAFNEYENREDERPAHYGPGGTELKAFDVGLGQYCEDGSPCVVAFDADRNPRLLNEKVYLKSEADNVIADLDESHKMEVEQLLMEIVKLKEERRWRKFPDEKPEEWDTVVVRIDDCFYDLAVYLSNGQGWDIGDGTYHKPEEVTHWMPLPSTPKEWK